MIVEIKSLSGRVIFTTEISDDVPERERLAHALREAVYNLVDLRGADLLGAYLRGADLLGANLSGAYLGGADLRGVDLRGADLLGANLGGADLRGANLSGAYLGGADLGSAYLGGANLSGANLSGAYLGGADLGSANLRDASVIDAGLDVRGYRFIARQGLDGCGMMVLAGCRWFTLDKARDHWSSAHEGEPSLQAECLGKVAMIEQTAMARGWQLRDEEAA